MQNNVTQRELDTFVNNHVVANQTMLVEELLKREVVAYDDISNLYEHKCIECGGAMKENNTKFVCESCDHTQDEEPEQEPQEIFEWYLVSPFLLKQLEKRGEPVLKTDFGSWWGRTCTGQAVSIDSVIEDIYKTL